MPHKLLIADDSVTIRRVIELTFADEDVAVTAVGDGDEAVRRILGDRPDIVLADVDMPGRSGYEVASFVKDDPDLARIPVLLLTGAFEPLDESRARAARCDGVLVKPFEPQVLIGRVRELLGLAEEPAAPAAGGPAGAPDEGGAAMPAGGVGLDLGAMEFRQPETPQPEGSLDDYFDRLDAAFAHLTGAPAGQENAAAGRPAQAGPAAGATPGARDAVSAPSSLPVSDAFAALLDEERTFGPDSVHAGQPREAVMPAREVPVDDALVEAVARRVAERLGEPALRKAVADVVSATAERLVREEIERIRNSVR